MCIPKFIHVPAVSGRALREAKLRYSCSMRAPWPSGPPSSQSVLLRRCYAKDWRNREGFLMFDRRITELWERPGEMARLVNYRRTIKCENLKKSSWRCPYRASSVATEQRVLLLSGYAFATQRWYSGDCQRHFKSPTNPYVRRNVLQSWFLFVCLFVSTKAQRILLSLYFCIWNVDLFRSLPRPFPVSLSSHPPYSALISSQ